MIELRTNSHKVQIGDVVVGGTEKWALIADYNVGSGDDDLSIREDGSDIRVVFQEGGNVGFGCIPGTLLEMASTAPAPANK